jgi:ketosteroid isomerase-like protein
MNRTKTAIAVLAGACALIVAATYAMPRPATPEEEVRALEQKVNADYEANDLPKYFSYYAADFTQYLPEGRNDLPAYKKEWTEYIGSGNRIVKVEISDMHIQVGPSGDTAVASYMLHVRTHLKDGKITDEDNQESDVLFKRNGEWKIVFLHYSPAPQKKG